MKVLLLNGSPRKEGCTFTALSEVAKTLNHNGIDTEIFQAGNPDTDNVKAAAAKLKEADALIVGSPVYWASPSGPQTSCSSCFCKKSRHHSYFRRSSEIFQLS